MDKKKHTIKREKIKGKYQWVERDETGKITGTTPWSANKAKASINYNLLKNDREKQYFEQKRKGKQLTLFEQLAQKQEELKQKELLKTYAEMIDKEKTIHLKRQKIETNGKVNRQRANALYKKILKDKKTPEKAIDKIIIKREQLLKHRFVATFELWTNKGLIGIINAGNILPEKELDAKTYWEGRTINSNEFPKHTALFHDILQRPRVYTAKQTNIPAGTITHIKTTWSFA